MLAELRLTAEQLSALQGHLLPDYRERAAVLLCGSATTYGILLTCREVLPLTDDDLESAGPLHLSVSPRTLARLAKRAANESGTLVICHSHPSAGQVKASELDLETEADLCGRALAARVRDRPVGALIVGPDGFDARAWACAVPASMAVRVAGRLVHGGDASHSATDERDARHLLLWGAVGQRRLRRASIAVVGAGGTGSHVAVQLAHLGIGRLQLVDPDVVEASNLSRLICACAADVGRRKVDVLAATVASIRPETVVEPVAESILEMDPERLVMNDVVVCCTDGHASRALLTELAAQYLMTLVDLGVEIQGLQGTTRAGGGVRVIQPGDPCLHCMRVIDPALVREEFLRDDERLVEAERGYLRGATDPAPSVVALNGVVASLAVMEILHELLALFETGRQRLLYRGEARSVTTSSVSRDESCYVCGRSGILGLADARPLPRRWVRA